MLYATALRDCASDTLPRRRWTTKEDEALRAAVDACGESSWHAVAAIVGSRWPWQCRERWSYHLRPGIKKDKWSKDEDAKLLALVEEHGSKWTLISRELPRRPPIAVKNRYRLLCTHKTSSKIKAGTPSSGSPTMLPRMPRDNAWAKKAELACTSDRSVPLLASLGPLPVGGCLAPPRAIETQQIQPIHCLSAQPTFADFDAAKEVATGLRALVQDLRQEGPQLEQLGLPHFSVHEFMRTLTQGMLQAGGVRAPLAHTNRCTG